MNWGWFDRGPAHTHHTMCCWDLTVHTSYLFCCLKDAMARRCQQYDWQVWCKSSSGLHPHLHTSSAQHFVSPSITWSHIYPSVYVVWIFYDTKFLPHYCTTFVGTFMCSPVLLGPLTVWILFPCGGKATYYCSLRPITPASGSGAVINTPETFTSKKQTWSL